MRLNKNGSSMVQAGQDILSNKNSRYNHTYGSVNGQVKVETVQTPPPAISNFEQDMQMHLFISNPDDFKNNVI